MSQNATAERDQNTAGSYAEPGRRGFLAGNPGRPKGIVDRRSQVKAEHYRFVEDGDPKLGLPPRRERIAALLTCGDLVVRAMLERFLFESEFGKPKETKDITIHGAVVEDAKDHMGGRIWGQLSAVPDEVEQEPIAKAG